MSLCLSNLFVRKKVHPIYKLPYLRNLAFYEAVPTCGWTENILYLGYEAVML